MKTLYHLARPFALVAAAFVVAGCVGLRADAPVVAQQRHFASPEEAVQALTDAAKSSDGAAMSALFGSDVKELLSGDPRQDAIERASFAKSLGQFSHLVRKTDDSYVLNIGAKNWPMPIPIVRRDGQWFFDTAAGKEEILSRRIGEDEITAINVCRTYVQAQREYASEDRDGGGMMKYSQRLKSTPEMKDGLYWPAKGSEEQSPLGPLVAEARAEGYSGKTVEGQPQPFHGYRFKILTAQGPAAAGGAYNYVINGNLIGGFALVAYPAHCGQSGVMTFIVNQWGKVYQSNLGEKSTDIASAMAEFNPDDSWSLVP
jgi:hypothetical protein